MPCTAPAVRWHRHVAGPQVFHALVLEDRSPPSRLWPAPPWTFRRSCETTGFSSEHDALIELAMLQL